MNRRMREPWWVTVLWNAIERLAGSEGVAAVVSALETAGLGREHLVEMTCAEHDLRELLRQAPHLATALGQMLTAERIRPLFPAVTEPVALRGSGGVHVTVPSLKARFANGEGLTVRDRFRLRNEIGYPIVGMYTVTTSTQPKMLAEVFYAEERTGELTHGRYGYTPFAEPLDREELLDVEIVLSVQPRPAEVDVQLVPAVHVAGVERCPVMARCEAGMGAEMRGTVDPPTASYAVLVDLPAGSNVLQGQLNSVPSTQFEEVVVMNGVVEPVARGVLARDGGSFRALGLKRVEGERLALVCRLRGEPHEHQLVLQAG